MLHIRCPYCEEYREEEEFSPAGQAHIERPLDPESLSDKDWANYLFFRKNPRGLHHEMWLHAHGCRKYFNMTRNTVTYKILETYKIGQQPYVLDENSLDENSADKNSPDEKSIDEKNSSEVSK